MSASDVLEDRRVESGNIGTRLRAAREAAGYSVDEIAARMRLSRDHIENMEAEHFDRFPVAVFLRGYLTGYARLLELDPNPLIEAYDRRGFGPPRLHSQESTQGRLRGSELTVTVTTLIVVAVLVVLSVLWWRERWGENGEAVPAGPTLEQFGEPGPIGGGAEDGAGGSAEAPDPAGARGELVRSPGDGRPPPRPEGSSRSGAPASEPGPGSDSAGGDAPSSVEEARSGTDAGAAGPSAEEAGPAVPAETEADADAAAESDGPAAPSARPASIVIRVREDCWIMIRDAEDRFVYRDLAAAGATLELSGVPPIRVVAGYAKGIDVEYDGEPFDLSPHIEQETGTARFQLGS